MRRPTLRPATLSPRSRASPNISPPSTVRFPALSNALWNPQRRYEPRRCALLPLSPAIVPPPSWALSVTDTRSHGMLFNDERYQRGNMRPGQRPFHYDHFAGGRLVGTLSGVVVDGLLDCGHSSPFGGIDWVRRREPVGTVVNLVHAAVAQARNEGIREIRVRARPAYFGANEAAVEFALLSLGASTESCEISLGVDPWRYASPEEYAATLDASARNTLNQGL